MRVGIFESSVSSFCDFVGQNCGDFLNRYSSCFLSFFCQVIEEAPSFLDCCQKVGDSSHSRYSPWVCWWMQYFPIVDVSPDFMNQQLYSSPGPDVLKMSAEGLNFFVEDNVQIPD